MKPITSRIAYAAIFSGALVAIGCSEKKQAPATPAKPKEESKVQQPAASAPQLDPAVAEINKPRPGIPAALTSRFAKLRGNGPKIPTCIEIRDDLFVGKLAAPSTRANLEILNQPSGGISAVEKLRSGEDLEGFDRESAVGTMALLVGWLTDDENKQNIHLLLGKRADTSTVTNGDALMLMLATEAAAMSSAGGPLTDSQKEEWGNLTKAKNPAMRQLAAVFLSTVAGFDDRTVLSKKYAEEPEFEIIKTVAESAQQLPPNQRREVLGALLEKQSSPESRELLSKLLQNP